MIVFEKADPAIRVLSCTGFCTSVWYECLGPKLRCSGQAMSAYLDFLARIPIMKAPLSHTTELSIPKPTPLHLKSPSRPKPYTALTLKSYRTLVAPSQLALLEAFIRTLVLEPFMRNPGSRIEQRRREYRGCPKHTRLCWCHPLSTNDPETPISLNEYALNHLRDPTMI